MLRWTRAGQAVRRRVGALLWPGIVEAFSPLDVSLLFYQLENAILLALGAAFLIAFFVANEPELPQR